MVKSHKYYYEEDLNLYFKDKYGINLYNVQPGNFFSAEGNKDLKEFLEKTHDEYSSSFFDIGCEDTYGEGCIRCIVLAEITQENGYLQWEIEIAKQLMKDLGETEIDTVM